MRGTLTHHYTCDERGICTSANLIVGTTNNNAPIHMVTKKIAQALIKPGKDPDQGILNMIEMGFRAFDPCYSCATHSLPGRDAARGARAPRRRGDPPLQAQLLRGDRTVKRRRRTEGRRAAARATVPRAVDALDAATARFSPPARLAHARPGRRSAPGAVVKTLLLGMGNPILCDDAVGIRLAGAVAERLGPRPGLDVVEECSVGGLNLLEVIAGYDRVVVLDSIMTGDGVPGTWYALRRAARCARRSTCATCTTPTSPRRSSWARDGNAAAGRRRDPRLRRRGRRHDVLLRDDDAPRSRRPSRSSWTEIGAEVEALLGG